MKSRFFVSDPIQAPKAYQLETEMNGALSMACQRAAPYVAAARSDGTRRLYARAFKRWADWCAAMHADALPGIPESIAAYLAEMAREAKSVATIKSALTAILYLHRQQGHRIEAQAPAIATVMAGIARRSSRPIRRAAALEIESLRKIVEISSLIERLSDGHQSAHQRSHFRLSRAAEDLDTKRERLTINTHSGKTIKLQRA